MLYEELVRGDNPVGRLLVGKGVVMGKRFQSRPPSRAVRLGLSAVLAIGLMPWGGVAVAAEGEGGLADAAASSFASVSGFYGWTSPHYSFDENGYPLYDENGNPIQELYSVDIRDADLSGDTLVVPKTFDMETSQRNMFEACLRLSRLRFVTLII